MRTEEEVISTLHDIVRSGEANQDDPINERLLRSFLRIHRGKHLSRAFRNGEQLPDEVFQNLGMISFFLENGNYVSAVLPKIIRFPQNFGFVAEKDDYTISVVESGEFKNSINDRFNKYHPKLKFINRKLFLYLGLEQSCDLEDVSATPLNRAVRKFLLETQSNTVNINLRAVLVDPDDEAGYDFTVDPYPMPDELIEDLMNSVTARDFNLFLRTKSDETGDKRHNVAEQNTREEL